MADILPYKTVKETVGKLQADFNSWSGMLSARSLEAAIGIIAANWAVHRTTDAILTRESS